MRLTYSQGILAFIGTALFWGPFVGAWFATAPCSWQFVIASAWLSSFFWFLGAALPMMMGSSDPVPPGLTNAIAAIWALVAASAALSLPGIFTVPVALIWRTAVIHCAGCS